MSNKDWSGNQNSIFKTLGASNHTDKERQTEDYYATDPRTSCAEWQKPLLHQAEMQRTSCLRT